MCLIAAGLAVPALLPASAAATWPGSAGRVFYDHFESSNSATYSIRPDGSHNRRLIKNANEPALSPDGSHIVFQRETGVFVARADGSHVHRVVKSFSEAIFDPQWSPHGNHISFTAYFEEQTGGEHVRTKQFVYIVRSNGRKLRRLHRGHAAAWSPRNRRIAFLVGDRILSIRPDGHRLRRLRSGLPDYVDAVDWSPNGRRLVYQVGAGPGHLEWLNVRTRKHHTLGAKRVGWPLDVAWAPGGNRIAYLHQHIPPSGQVFPPTVMRTIKPNGRGRRDVFKFRPLRWPESFAWQTR